MTVRNTLTLTAILLTIIILSCKGSKLRNHYSGFVVDDVGKPISGVLVREDLLTGNNDTTNNLGYFKVERTDNCLPNLIFSKKGYRTDTVEMDRTMHGEKSLYSDLITRDSSKWIMHEIVYRDSTLNWSDKLLFFDNDSIEMRRDGRLMYTQYLNRKKDEIIYQYYDYHGAVERKVYNIDMETEQIHFQDYKKNEPENIEYKAYLCAIDSIPELLKDNLGKYWRIGVVKEMDGEKLLSEKYISWDSPKDCITGQNEEYIGKKRYINDDNYSYKIEKMTNEGYADWLYYTNGLLREHSTGKYLYGANFSTFFIRYDSSGHKMMEINWTHSFPDWGQSYNDTFSVTTTKEYYPNGKPKSITKTKSFCEGDDYRCGIWIYYDEKGKVVKTEKYGNCNNFVLEEKYNDNNFSEDEE